MKNTKYISASAGSGKTFNIVKEMVELVSNGIEKNGERTEVNGNQVIMTTFTEKAAAELQEKARKGLEDNGRFRDAALLGNAIIGTIHSVAYKFISKYWYLAKVSAQVRILSEEDKRQYVNTSLSSIAEKEDIAYFSRMRDEFDISDKFGGFQSKPDYYFWKNHLQRIIEMRHSFQIEDLSACKDLSLEMIDELFGNSDAIKTAGDVKEAIKSILELCNSIAGTLSTGNAHAQKASSKIVEKYNSLNQNPSLADVLAFYYDKDTFLGLESKKYAECVLGELSQLETSICQLCSCAYYRNWQKEYVTKIFEMAGRFEKQYRQYKNSQCLLDFNDLEQKFFELLGHEDVVDDIRTNFKALFVDEFQDCSPLQIRIFERLGDMMESVAYVGDIKQAIYGFRGTDVDLVKKVLDQFPKDLNKPDENGNVISTLKESWRSTETLVKLANDIFVPAFANEIPEGLVKLTKATGQGSCTAEDCKPEQWYFDVRNKGDFAQKLAVKVFSLVRDNNLKPKDVAVLFRNNRGALDFADNLKQLKLPVNLSVDEKESEDPRTIQLANAIVSLLIDPSDDYAKAVIQLHCRRDYHLSQLLEERINEQNAKDEKENGKALDWDENEVVRFILAKRDMLKVQSVSSAVESVLNESGVKEYLENNDNAGVCQLAIDGYIATARAYEDMCRNKGIGASLPGLLTHLANHGALTLKDEDGVFVGTYHKSKGLQWDTVICAQLESDPNISLGDTDKNKKNIYGVQTFKMDDAQKCILLPYLNSSIDKLFSQKFANDDEDDKSIRKFYEYICKKSVSEEKRLMYVGMTRAQRLLVFPTFNSRGGNPVAWLDALGVTDAKGTVSNILPGLDRDDTPETERRIMNVVCQTDVTVTLPEPAQTFRMLKKNEPVLPVALYVEPSKIENNELVGKAKVEKVKDVSKGVVKGKSKESAALYGTYFHHVLMCWQIGEDNSVLIKNLAHDYGVLTPDEDTVRQITETAEGLFTFLKDKYGTSEEIYRELPFRFDNEEGQIITGQMDMVYKTANGMVIVDYKTCEESIDEIMTPQSYFYAGKYAPQLNCYGEVLKGSNCKVLDTLLFYPAHGTVVSVSVE